MKPPEHILAGSDFKTFSICQSSRIIHGILRCARAPASCAENRSAIGTIIFPMRSIPWSRSHRFHLFAQPFTLCQLKAPLCQLKTWVQEKKEQSKGKCACRTSTQTYWSSSRFYPKDLSNITFPNSCSESPESSQVFESSSPRLFRRTLPRTRRLKAPNALLHLSQDPSRSNESWDTPRCVFSLFHFFPVSLSACCLHGIRGEANCTAALPSTCKSWQMQHHVMQGCNGAS